MRGVKNMKKWMWLSIILILSTFLGACGSSNLEVEGTQEKENIFSEEDIENADEMVIMLNQTLKDFEDITNEEIRNGEITFEDEKTFNTRVQSKANQYLKDEFLSEYKEGIIPEEFRGENQIFLYFNKTHSEPCSLGFCEYDGIEIMDIQHNNEDIEEYTSSNFEVTELIFNNTKYSYESDEEEESSSAIRFVKSEAGELIISQHPALSFNSLDLKELDKEYEAIRTNTPESEIETAQAEYKAEVEETLSKFPELQ